MAFTWEDKRGKGLGQHRLLSTKYLLQSTLFSFKGTSPCFPPFSELPSVSHSRHFHNLGSHRPGAAGTKEKVLASGRASARE